MKKILTVSSANMDFVMDMPEIPASGQTVICTGAYKYVPGGKGANSAVAFARLGAESVFCTCLGNDTNGDTLLSIYNMEGIATDFIERTDESPTGLAAIMVDDLGANRIAVYPGANMKIGDKAIENAIASRPDALYMQMEIAHKSIVFAANAARAAGIPIFIDAGPADPKFPFEELPPLEIFSPNESETEILTGIFPKDGASCLAAAQKLSTLVRSHYYVIKLGERGCFVTDLTESFAQPSFKTSVVDTTAAGDSFTAALTLEYLKSGDIKLAARYANAVGALAVSKAGAIPSIPTQKDVDRFLSTQ